MPRPRKANRSNSAEEATYPTLQESAVEVKEPQGSNALSKYYGEVSRTVLLTPMEEIELGRVIAKSKDQQEQQMAIDTLTESNLRLVLKMANKYRNRGLSMEDLIQEGNIGLMKASRKFRIEKGCRFSTYAIWWIRQGMSRALADIGRTIRLPVHAGDKVRKMYQVTGYLTEKLQREPLLEEIAKEMGISLQKARNIYQLSDLDCLSLDAPIADHETSSHLDMTADKSSPDPLVDLERKVTVDKVRQALALMDPRRREILEMRFGITGRGHEEKTLQEVGNCMNVTRERIRQLQVQAIAMLKGPLARTMGMDNKKPRKNTHRA